MEIDPTTASSQPPVDPQRDPPGRSGPLGSGAFGGLPDLPGDTGSGLANEHSPFAQMFKRAGAPLTGKELMQLMQGLLKQQVSMIKQQQESWKKSMQKIKEAWEGDDS